MLQVVQLYNGLDNPRMGKSVWFCEHGNEHLFHNGRKFLDKLNNLETLKEFPVGYHGERWLFGQTHGELRNSTKSVKTVGVWATIYPPPLPNEYMSNRYAILPGSTFSLILRFSAE
jgi:hypothetical protein